MTQLEKLREKVELLTPVILDSMNLLGGDAEEELGRSFDYVRTALKAVEEEQRWIPVEEELPKPHEDILFVTTKGDIWRGYFVDDLWGWEAYGIVFSFSNEEVNCWRPLPKGPEKIKGKTTP